MSRQVRLAGRLESLAVVVTALFLAFVLPNKATAYADPTCLRTCVSVHGTAFWAADQFYVLNDCGPTSDGGTWCQYVRTN